MFVRGGKLVGNLAYGFEDNEFPEVEVSHSSERVFLPGRKNPVILKPNATALLLLQRVRNEAPRFAITYHRMLRAKERLSSPLDAIDASVWPNAKLSYATLGA